MATTTEALLNNSHGGGGEEEEEEEEEEEALSILSRKGGFWNNVLDVEEAKTQVLFSVPMIVANVSYYAIPLISVMFAGRLGQLELAGATLANSWATVTGFALMDGLSGALETLCGQGYGAKLYRILGIYLQSSIITTFFFSIIISFIWFYSETILILLHQEPQIAKMAAIFLRHLIPGLFAYAFLQCLLRYLQTQSVVTPLVACSVIPLVIHIGITYVMVYHTFFGFKGAALSVSLSLWIAIIMLGIYVNYSEKFKYTWEGLSTEFFRHVLPNMKLAIPSAVMVCLEFWAFEILVLLAGMMPNSEINTLLTSMCVGLVAMAYIFTYGFSAAASTRVSNELGAGNVKRAKNSVAVAVKLSIIFSLAVILFLVFSHNICVAAFSDNPVIKIKFASMTPFLAMSILLDSAQGVLSGVSRGCRWQHLAAWTNLVAFYAIGMPISILLAFPCHLHTHGLWMGVVCAHTFQSCILLFITLQTNWIILELSMRYDKEKNMLV